jgi:hypothetical protein
VEDPPGAGRAAQELLRDRSLQHGQLRLAGLRAVAPPLNEPSNGGTNCDGNHIANLDNPATGLVHDLKSAVTTPAFSWITPDNCSDAHDAVCHGNNLSGAFNANGTPNYNSPIPDDPESTTPTGPNSTLGTNSKGDQLYPGPGDNAFVDRPPVCTQTSPALVPSDCVPGIVEGGAGSPPAARTDTVTGGASSSTITNNSIVADDTGRAVTGTNIPASSFVGAVTDTGPQFPTTNTGSATVGSFQLVSQDGTPVDPSGPVSSITLSAEGDPSDLAKGQTPDPLFNATLPTTGGGDTGSVLISPFIRPGTVSTVYYNHYSWLRTMEDLFNVKAGHDHTPLPAGTVSGGPDGRGHIGYAAQPGLRPFGRDVFNNPSGFGLASLDSYTTPGGVAPSSPWVRTSLAVGAPALALIAAGGYLMYLRRRRTLPGQA